MDTEKENVVELHSEEVLNPNKDKKDFKRGLIMLAIDIPTIIGTQAIIDCFALSVIPKNAKAITKISSIVSAYVMASMITEKEISYIHESCREIFGNVDKVSAFVSAVKNEVKKKEEKEEETEE